MHNRAERTNDLAFDVHWFLLQHAVTDVRVSVITQRPIGAAPDSILRGVTIATLFQEPVAERFLASHRGQQRDY